MFPVPASLPYHEFFSIGIDKMKMVQVVSLWMLAAPVIAGNIETFELGGVRLGMSPNEAKAIVQSKCKRDDGIFQDASGYQHPFVPRKQFSLGYICRTEVVTFAVQMAALPTGPVVVEQITSKMTWNSENMKSLRESAVEKYGKPTHITSDGFRYEWCENPEPVSGDHQRCLSSRQPKIMIGHADIELSDPRYRDQVAAAHKAKMTSKPLL